MSSPRTIVDGWLPERLAVPGVAARLGGGIAALGVIAAGLFLAGLGGMIGLADYLGVWLLLLPLALLGAFLAWRHERIWVYSALGAHLVAFMSSRNEGIGGGEVAFALVTLFGLLVWFVKEVAVHRRIIVRSGFDALLLGIFVTTSVVGIAGNVLHGGEPVRIIKELSPMLDLLLYFPVRAVIRTRRDVVKLLTVLGVIGFAMGVVGVMTYRERLLTAVFAYQIEHSRVFTNESISIIYAIFGVVVVAYANRRWTVILGLLMTTSGLLFLVITFSRGSIVSASLGIVVVMLFSGHGRRVATVLIASLVIGSGVVYLAYPNIAKTMATSVGRRLSTVGSTMTDVSFNLRVIEANTILRLYLPHSPIIGYGYGVRYHWYDPTERTTTNHTFIHNGYVRLLYKYGIPLAVLFLFFLVYPLLRILLHWPTKRDQMQHALVIGVGAYLVAGLANNYVSDMFSHYSGPLNYVLCWAILDYVNRQRQPATLLPPPATAEPLAVAGV